MNEGMTINKKNECELRKNNVNKKMSVDKCDV